MDRRPEAFLVCAKGHWVKCGECGPVQRVVPERHPPPLVSYREGEGSRAGVWGRDDSSGRRSSLSVAFQSTSRLQGLGHSCFSDKTQEVKAQKEKEAVMFLFSIPKDKARAALSRSKQKTEI